ncbi:hypothetical protein [Helicobacter fennelliae]|uniref:Uncharacterized protein n=1 Tax=Helicobacter fennelliae MRY12-0050 TaxID=1325130 RepID=T1DVD8_9HELI|nr:hypothetical protein [Helicobacter fennelliae]GAD18452.1 hypothetical protein HFN_2380 [Helicobacter fennelliae MRY12-0050]
MFGNSAFSQTSTRSYFIQDLYGYAQAGLMLNVEKNINVSLNYNGLFASTIESHTAYMQFDWLF